MNKRFLVFDEGSGGSVATATPPADGSVANPATPPEPQQDAEKLADYEAKIAKYEEDMRKMKSSLQQNEGRLKQQLEARERQFKEEMDRMRRSMLDEDELKEYEAEYSKTAVAELEQKYREAQSALEQEQALRSTVALFAQAGVPMDLLIKASDEGLEKVTQVAWQWTFDERKRLAAELAAKGATPPNKTQGQPPEKPPTAPATSTQTAPPFTGPKWPELVKQYGSREVVYTLVEAGRLPATIIPPEE